LPNEKKELKVTDKRIFTAEGDIREEFRDEIRPADPAQPKPAPAQEIPAEQPETKSEAPREERRSQKSDAPHGNERRRTVKDEALSPGTPFANFVEQLVVQAYMSLGMLRHPSQPQTPVDPTQARQMIDILNLLKEKTAGNLTPEEEDFLTTHLGELKLAFVQRTKSI
jgi:hypothetical protein